MSDTDFLPRREADLRGWSIAFNNNINSTPQEFGISIEQAADYNAKHNVFMVAFALARSGPSRGPSRTLAKNDALRTLKKAARQLARSIRTRPFITATQKKQLGLTVRGRGGKSARIPPPATRPTIHIMSNDNGRLTLLLRDSAQPFRKGRPRGVSGKA